MARRLVGGEDISGLDIVGALDIVGKLFGKEARLERLQRREARRDDRDDDGDRDSLLERRISKLMGKVSPTEQLAQQTPEVLRNFPMPLGRKDFAAGASDFLQQNAQRTIRIQRLVLSSADLADFDVTSINLGVEQQLAAIAAMPAETFEPRAVGTTFRGTTLQVGQTASVGLTDNAAAGTQSIAGVFFGEALQF